VTSWLSVRAAFAGKKIRDVITTSPTLFLTNLLSTIHYSFCFLRCKVTQFFANFKQKNKKNTRKRLQVCVILRNFARRSVRGTGGTSAENFFSALGWHRPCGEMVASLGLHEPCMQ
jgi:hypothetical protein